MAIKNIFCGKSKNLCDVLHLLTLPIDKTYEGYGYWEVEIDVEPNTVYTFSRENANQINVGGAMYLGIINQYISPNGGNTPWLNHNSLPGLCHQNVQITTGAEGKLWIFFSANVYKKWQNHENPFGYLQLEKGSIATEYVPYELTSYKSVMKVSDVCQLADKSKFAAGITRNGITCVNNGDGSITLNGTCTSGFVLNLFNQSIPVDQTHIYYASPYLSINYSGSKDGTTETGHICFIKTSAYPTKFKTPIYIWIDKDESFSNVTIYVNVDDLTEMFGAGNEPKTVAEFKAKFPNDYYPYSPSCFVTSFDERMPCKTKNLFDINAEMHNAIKPEYYIEVIGSIVKTNYDISHVVYPYIEVPVKIGETYTFSCNTYRSSNTINVFSRVRYPDNTVVTHIGKNPVKKTFTATQSSIQVCFGIDTGGTFDTSQFAFIYNIQLEKGSTATDYVPYGYV